MVAKYTIHAKWRYQGKDAWHLNTIKIFFNEFHNNDSLYPKCHGFFLWLKPIKIKNCRLQNRLDKTFYLALGVFTPTPPLVREGPPRRRTKARKSRGEKTKWFGKTLLLLLTGNGLVNINRVAVVNSAGFIIDTAYFPLVCLKSHPVFRPHARITLGSQAHPGLLKSSWKACLY